MIFLSGYSFAITRDRIIKNAKAYAEHKWQCRPENTVVPASCSKTWKSDYTPGWYVGVCYDWGGYKSIEQFDQDLANGLGAGSHSKHGILPCTTGVDCSGFVTQVWETSHHTTSTMKEVARTISMSDLKIGDAFNRVGHHIVLYAGKQVNGVPVFYEASGSASKVRRNTFGGWSYVANYVPVRYKWVQENPVYSKGTFNDPIVIKSVPFVDNNSTSKSRQMMLDRYSCKPSADESGPEIVYMIRVKKGGVLTASVTDPAGVDVDVHLLNGMDENNCIVRGDRTLKYNVGPGNYYIVVDSWVNKDGVAFDGSYTLKVDFSGEIEGEGGGSGDGGSDQDAFEDTYENGGEINKKDSAGGFDVNNMVFPDASQYSEFNNNGCASCTSFAPSSSNWIYILIIVLILSATRLFFALKRK